MNNVLEIDIAWGGYYACTSKDSDGFSIIRLLDFNRDAYHASLYSEGFKEFPSPEDVMKLTPFIGHAPIDAKGLLNYESISLIDRKPLTQSDLEGYMYYLAEFEVSENERKELTESLISFSKDTPLALRLYISDNELQIEERV